MKFENESGGNLLVPLFKARIPRDILRSIQASDSPNVVVVVFAGDLSGREYLVMGVSESNILQTFVLLQAAFFDGLYLRLPGNGFEIRV